MNFMPKIYDFKTTYEDLAEGGTSLVTDSIPAQNIVQRLQSREIFNGRRIGTEKYLERSMCQSIFPNFTVTSIEKPPIFMRKFTPDGKYFLAYSADQVSVEIYKFNGPQAAAKLFIEVLKTPESFTFSNLDNLDSADTSGDSFAPSLPKKRKWTENSPWDRVIGPQHTDELSQQIRDRLFSAFFVLKHKIKIAPPGEQLNRECSLFTEDSRYMIVGSANYIHDEFHHPTFQEMYRNNESVEPNFRYPLEDTTVHIVDIIHGVRRDSINLKVDKIFLSHNQGIYLYKKTLAILSVQHQTVHLYYVDDGAFYPLRSIGRFCHEDDELLLSKFPLFRPNRAFEDKSINTLKHRILAYLHKKAYRKFLEERDLSKLNQFHLYFERLKAMRIWKMQLLDEDHLLMKYASPDVVTLKVLEPNSHYCLFVIYCISSTEVLEIFDNNSEQLVDLYEFFTDNFRNNFLTPEGRFCSSPSNNIYSMQIHRNFRQTITSARFGGPSEAMKRILTGLPISAQSYTPSPYLDQALFSYDDHRISVMERPKAFGDTPIQFYGRDSGLFKYEMYAGALQRTGVPPGRRLVAYIFHPTAPFAISVQRANAEYVVNFHFRLNTSTLTED